LGDQRFEEERDVEMMKNRSRPKTRELHKVKDAKRKGAKNLGKFTKIFDSLIITQKWVNEKSLIIHLYGSNSCLPLRI
jgi:hypothetical protein